MENAIQLTDKKRTIIFLNIVIVCIATTMMTTALTSALPPIIAEFGITASTAQWLSSGYSICMGVMIPMTAFLIKRFSTKPLYLFSIIIFIIGLFLDLTASGFAVLMLGRILQGCSNGLITSLSQVVLMTIYPIEKRGTVMGWYGLSLSAAPVVAPTIAGVLIDNISWRAVFALPLVIMLFSLAAAYFSFENVFEGQKIKVDMVSFVLCALAFGSLSFAIGNISTYGLLNPFTAIPLVLGAVTAILFVRKQFDTEEPFLDLRVFESRNYNIAVISSILHYMLTMANVVLLPLFIQSTLGESATVSGLIMLPGSLLVTFVTPISGKFFDKNGIKRIYMLMSFMAALANGMMFFVTGETSLWMIAGINVIRQFSGGLTMVLASWGTNYVKKEQTADATAIITALRTIGGAIGMSVFVGIMSSVAVASTNLSSMEASVRGMNVSYLCMSFVYVVMFLISVFLVKDDKK